MPRIREAKQAREASRGEIRATAALLLGAAALFLAGCGDVEVVDPSMGEAPPSLAVLPFDGVAAEGTGSRASLGVTLARAARAVAALVRAWAQAEYGSTR